MQRTKDEGRTHEVKQALPLDFNELRQLLETIAQTDIVELTLKSTDFELTVRKAIGISNQVMTTGGVSSGLTAPLTAATTSVAPGTRLETVPSRDVDTGVTIGAQLPLPAPTPLDQKLVEVVSPMVGTFYRSPAPGEASFVEVGDRIRFGQIVCIIEAMKLMNEIESEVSGQVVEILVQNGEPIEFGQPLLRVKPD